MMLGRGNDMTGSTQAAVVIPIVALLLLAAWLALVFYADSHPEHGNSTIPPQGSTRSAALQQDRTAKVPRPREEGPVSSQHPAGSTDEIQAGHPKR